MKHIDVDYHPQMKLVGSKTEAATISTSTAAVNEGNAFCEFSFHIRFMLVVFFVYVDALIS